MLQAGVRARRPQAVRSTRCASFDVVKPGSDSDSLKQDEFRLAVTARGPAYSFPMEGLEAP